ncbi:class I SAM-dependent methyltransferase [Azospirillum sp.]|uniref:class I SAM-dependent methyltransferase n=1 Tax=Azospirillum sp. TaxID=34012 RepID=UPI00260F8DC4|nr:class I SAM-dependent methyltransferase [Azospirillum sp.]
MNRAESIDHAARMEGLKEYQTQFCIDADQKIGFSGKDVLEIGGHLPERFVLGALGARSWTALEDMTYWPEGMNFPIDFHSFTDAALSEQPYRILNGKIEELPTAFHRRFDLIVSIAAFQHIHMLPSALDTMFHALRPNGRLLAFFGPVWSAPQGHILSGITDALGRDFNFGQSPLPDWGHLYLSSSEAYLELCKKMDRPTAARIVFQIYTSSRVNRFFVEDYIQFARLSLFASHGGLNNIYGAGLIPLPPERQSQLEALYPGRKRFDITNLIFDMTRRE